MANIKSAKKRARQGEVRRLHNASQRSAYRTALKRVLEAIEAGDKSKATEAYKTAVSMIDKAATKGLLHANKAARHKSRLNKHIAAIG